MSTSHRMRFALWGVAAATAVALVVVFLQGSTWKSTEQLWAETCAETKTQGMKLLGSRKRSEPPLEPSRQVPPVWRLRWAGTTIPVPAIRYDEILLDHGQRPGLVELTLKSKDESVEIELRWERDGERWYENAREPLKSLFEREEAKEVLDREFGAHFQTRGEWMATQHALDELTCEPDRLDEELAPLIAVGSFSSHVSFGGEPPKIFSIPAPTQVPVPQEGKVFPAAHPKIVGGLAEKRDDTWSISLIPESTTSPPAEIEYRVRGKRYVDIGHLIASDFESAGDEPHWWDDVQRLLDHPTQPSIDAALEAFNREAVDPRVRLGLAELERVVSGQKEWGDVSPARAAGLERENQVTF